MASEVANLLYEKLGAGVFPRKRGAVWEHGGILGCDIPFVPQP